MNDPTNNQAPKEGGTAADGHYRFTELEESWFPNNEGDFASSFMSPSGSANELPPPRKLCKSNGLGFLTHIVLLAPVVNPHSWQDANSPWLFDRNMVVTDDMVRRYYEPLPRISKSVPASREPDTSQPPSMLPEPENVQTPEATQQTEGLLLPGNLQEPTADSAQPSLPLISSRTHDPTVSETQVTADTIPQKDSGPKNTGKKSFREWQKKFKFVGWNDESKLMLYRWKGILRKGPLAFIQYFPGETVASLREAWGKYCNEGKRLYEEWEATAVAEEE